MEKNSKRPPEVSVEQEIIVLPDGRIEIQWVNPNATRLVVDVCQDISGEPFPVCIISGNLYCG